MRWKAPQPNETRRRRKFLWFPLRWKGEWCWLERVTMEERFYPFSDGGFWGFVRLIDEDESQ